MQSASMVPQDYHSSENALRNPSWVTPHPVRHARNVVDVVLRCLNTDDFCSIRQLCYPQTNVFLLCFSVISPASFYNLRDHWLPEIRQCCQSPPPVLLIGTQCDLRANVNVCVELGRRGESPVAESDARELAREIGAVEYLECSALTQHNLKQVFDAAILAGLKGAPATSSFGSGSSGRVWFQEYKGRRSFRRMKEKLLVRSGSVASSIARKSTSQSPKTANQSAIPFSDPRLASPVRRSLSHSSRRTAPKSQSVSPYKHRRQVAGCGYGPPAVTQASGQWNAPWKSEKNSVGWKSSPKNSRGDATVGGWRDWNKNVIEDPRPKRWRRLLCLA